MRRLIARGSANGLQKMVLSNCFHFRQRAVVGGDRLPQPIPIGGGAAEAAPASRSTPAGGLARDPFWRSNPGADGIENGFIGARRCIARVGKIAFQGCPDSFALAPNWTSWKTLPKNGKPNGNPEGKGESKVA
jgi:hypothetical protein